MSVNVNLSKEDLGKLKSLKEILIEDDLLDLDGYGFWEREDRISNAWDALKVIDRILISPITSTAGDGDLTQEP